MKHFLITGLLCLLIPVSVFADYYRYVDDTGVVRYTDDLSNVPEQYQDRVTGRPSVTSTESDLPQNIIQESEKKSRIDHSLKRDFQKKASSKTDKALKEEYRLLMKEKDQLEQEIKEWSKRYRTRDRKSVARAKLKELREAESKWNEKYAAWQAKQKANDK